MPKDEQEYLRLLESMTEEGYRLFAPRDSGVIVSLAGFVVLTNLYYGHHIWVYDLVTRSNARSKGCSCQLLEFVEEFARQEGCTVFVSSGRECTNAHRFYEKHMDYEKPTSYVFKRAL